MRWSYRCPSCGAEYPIEPGRYLCDPCAAKQKPEKPLEGVLECVWLDEDAAVARELGPEGIPLPVEEKYFAPVPVGDTPLWAPARLREELGFPRLFLKDDTCEPTGSFKDRASALVAAFALKHGIREIALASTGNAASSMSGIGAAAGLGITVFLPKAAPAAKRLQVLQYGAELRQVDGNYDQAFEESLAYSKATGVLSRNTGYNPLTIEGKKTVSFEILADLRKAGLGAELGATEPAGPSGAAAPRGASGQVAPAGLPALEIFVPAGDGVILSGVYKGFEDLMRLGRIDRMPRVWACQAQGSSALARALESGGFGPPVPSDTIADSISVDVPRNGAYSLSKLKRHGGAAAVVSDEELLAAQRMLSSKAGLFAEPSSSAALAGFLKVRDRLDRNSIVVLLVTGSGLKDLKSAARAVGVEL
ncbi:MAG TPA: pyridoxal-phosphate dependent enzyme [Rectinemataceae bacterium]|nr:pyridoxal-phosphate dependent enzyme [Rectinemataceae bacterium]